MADGFEEEEFIDAENWFWIASRKIASIHAFGGAVATETRFSDFRPVNGIVFPFSSKEVDVATRTGLHPTLRSDIERSAIRVF